MTMRTSILTMLFAACLGGGPGGPLQAQPKTQPVTLKRITTNLYAEKVESCVRFWVDRLGFERIMEVPDGKKLAFALLKKGDLELMYGSYDSLAKVPELVKSYARGTSFVYIEVDRLDDIVAAMKDADIVESVHVTFYGAKEMSIRDPGGHIITFAQFQR